jgi:hypothetical protein
MRRIEVYWPKLDALDAHEYGGPVAISCALIWAALYFRKYTLAFLFSLPLIYYFAKSAVLEIRNIRNILQWSRGFDTYASLLRLLKQLKDDPQRYILFYSDYKLHRSPSVSRRLALYYDKKDDEMIAVHPTQRWVLKLSEALGIQVQPCASWGWSKTIITALADGALVVAWDQRRDDCCTADEHELTDQEAAVDRTREAALRVYLDQMAEFLLEKKLRTTDREDVRNDAQSHTLTTLPKLDGYRKGYLLRFVYETGLINKDSAVLQLSGADLSEAKLSWANLGGADLSGANLSSADLWNARLEDANMGGADLRQANLSYARLHNADLHRANLQQANLRSARMRGANLNDANLHEANLERANLDLADLRGATVTDEQLAEAWRLKETTMPDGSRWAGE